MPFCHRHPDTQVITDYLGVSFCVRCEREAKAAGERQCGKCAAPVSEPGLCPACNRVAVTSRPLEWIAEHPLIIAVVILLFGLWLSLPGLCRLGLAAYKLGGGDERNPEGFRVWVSLCGW